MGICCVCCIGSCCFNSASTKQLQVALIVLNSISFVFLHLCMIFIQWKEIYNSNLYIFIIMFVMTILYLIFTILIRYWGSTGELKTTKKGTASCFSIIALILNIAHFILCIVEEVIITISFNRADFPCYDYKDNTSRTRTSAYRRNEYEAECIAYGSDYDANVISVGEYYLAYITLSYLELALIFTLFLWSLLRQRIDAGLDGPVVDVVPAQVAYPQAVVVIQPGYSDYQYQQNTPYIYNQQVSSSNRPSNNRPNVKSYKN